MEIEILLFRSKSSNLDKGTYRLKVRVLPETETSQMSLEECQELKLILQTVEVKSLTNKRRLGLFWSVNRLGSVYLS